MDPIALTRQRVLITSLNWGMGHLARSIALIYRLIDQKNEVYFAGSDEQVNIIKQYHPSIKFLPLPPYPFSFKLERSFKLSLLMNSYSLFLHVKKERKAIEELLGNHFIDVVISDHRYGCYSPKVKSIFLTHQIQFPLNGLWKLGNSIHKRLMKPFDCIWVPDYPDRRLSRDLSTNVGFKKLYFTGPLSRFEMHRPGHKEIDRIVVLSGPDAHAVQFAKHYFSVTNSKSSTVLIAKSEVIHQLKLPGNVKTVESTNWLTCDAYIASAKQLVSACGYTTLMDLEFLTCQPILTPTPGQPEQEYLWEIHSERLANNAVNYMLH